jgi:hypothetical protein
MNGAAFATPGTSSTANGGSIATVVDVSDPLHSNPDATSHTFVAVQDRKPVEGRGIGLAHKSLPMPLKWAGRFCP